MAFSERFFRPVNVFSEKTLPDSANQAGYGLLVDRYGLKLPAPVQRPAGVLKRNERVETADFLLLPVNHTPPDTLSGHLEFALKWEGVNLAVLIPKKFAQFRLSILNNSSRLAPARSHPDIV